MMGMRRIGMSCLIGKLGRRMVAGGLAVVLLTGTGCADKQSVPSGILPFNKMQTVMWDMIQADQYAVLAVAKDSAAKDSAAHINAKAETLKLYEEVFRLHDVSREEFHKSYRYYLNHPELNQRLFDSLISQGSQLRTESYSRPSSYHPAPIIPPPHLPAGTRLPAPGVTAPHSAMTTPPGHPKTFPPHQPVILPGMHPLIPGRFPAKVQKDSVRKHS